MAPDNEYRRLPTPSCVLHDDGKSAWGFVWDGRAGEFGRVRIDLDFVGRFDAHRWRLNREGYAITSIWNTATKQVTHVALHRMVTNAPAGVLVDHRWGNRRDARKVALRFATYTQNAANRRGARRNKLSKFRGVTVHKQTGKFQAGAKHLDRFIHGGLHENEEEAALAYNRIAKRIWGRFAVLNRVRKGRTTNGDAAA